MHGRCDSKQLYQEVILDHNRKPRNWGALADATHQAEGHNPLCGDHLSVTLEARRRRGGRDHLPGRVVRDLQGVGVDDDDRGQGQEPRGDAEQLIREFRDMATGKLDLGGAAPPRAADGVRRRARPADAREVRDPAVAHAARGAELGRERHDRGRGRSDARADRQQRLKRNRR